MLPATCLMCSAHWPKAQEKQQLVEQLSGLNAAHTEEMQRLRAEMQRLQEDVARDAQVQQLQERLAELERHSMKSCLGQEVEELRQVSLSIWGMLLLCWGSTGLSRDLASCCGPWRRPPAAGAGLGQGSGCTCPSSCSTWQRWKPRSCSWRRRGML